MIKETISKAINQQINREMFSEYFYLAMASFFENKGLSGFANFFKVQVEEERFHAMKFYNYLNERGGRVRLSNIEAPQDDFNSPLEVFEMALKHEEFITKSINDLMELAMNEKDFATMSLLNWFIDEQVEEEASMNTIVDQLRMINNEGHGLMMLDKELATRTFTPPTN